jgi:hypothetical protein
MGAPWSACISPGATQHLFTGDGNGKIYKFDLDGKLLGWAQTSQNHGQNGCLVHELHCESDTVSLQGRLLDVAGGENHNQPVSNC